MLTQERLKEVVNYNSDTGIFTYLINGNNQHVKIGYEAGSINKGGYTQIAIDQKRYYAHRLVWLYIYGYFPNHQIDHINGIRNDNCFDNLREATNSQNNMNKSKPVNNTSGYKGISWTVRDNKWRAYISINKQQISLGYFNNIDDAIEAVANGTKKYHGEFGNYG